MANFKKLIRRQIQEKLNKYSDVVYQKVPKSGWIRTIRDALGVSSYVLADRLQCSRVNVTAIEQRETQGNVTIETLQQVAKALNCKLVYALVPLEPLDVMLEKQARMVAKDKIALVNHSMKLEDQGLDIKQLQEQEDDLVEELLQNNVSKLWDKK